MIWIPTRRDSRSDTDLRTLADALAGADVFVGLSVSRRSFARHGRMRWPSVRSSLRWPTRIPEILPEDVKAVRKDAIIATGRTDYPNQVNNVLGFPFIFRGALDVQARAINEEMKMAATDALAELAKEDVPEAVATAYGVSTFQFGPDYLIPKPFDPRVLLWVAPAVAEAAMESGVARQTIDLDALSHTTRSPAGPAPRSHARSHAQSAPGPQAHRFSRGRERTVIRAAVQSCRGRHRPAGPAGPREVIREKAQALNARSVRH